MVEVVLVAGSTLLPAKPEGAKNIESFVNNLLNSLSRLNLSGYSPLLSGLLNHAFKEPISSSSMADDAPDDADEAL
jgi:hypothetical protein